MGLVLACPDWQTDGPWGRWDELHHYRIQIGLPIAVGDLGRIKVNKCQCGKTLDLVDIGGPSPNQESKS